jgi:hypothetical protein
VTGQPELDPNSVSAQRVKLLELDIRINHSAKLPRAPRMLQNLLRIEGHLNFLEMPP